MDGCDPKDITCSDAAGFFFVHYQVKLCVGRIKDILVDNFAKKGLVFFSGLMTGGMENPLDIGKADRSQSFKKTDINVSLTECLTTGPG